MSLPATHSPSLQVPRIEVAADGAALVVRWGQVLGTLLRPGDRLVPGPIDAPVVLLMPRGRGRPMLARRDGRRLLALPGMVPVSPERWSVAFGVLCVERALERGAPGDQDLHVVTRSEAPGQEDTGVVTEHGQMGPRELDGLCIRSLVEPRRTGLRVSLAAAPEQHQALDLLRDTPAGCLRFALGAPAPAHQGRVIAGPWPGSSAAPPRSQVPLPFSVDTRRTA